MIATKNGVEFEHKEYQAAFVGCSFENNNQMRHEKFWVFIATYNIDGVKVYASHFVDKQTNSTYPNPYNAGIVALNGNVHVQFLPIGSEPACYFEGLYFGVEARAFGADLNFKVLRSTFRDCNIGILNSGYSSPNIMQNTIQFQKIPQWNYRAAIHLQDGMNDITVQDNKVTGFIPFLNTNTNGIFVNEIGAASNKIRRNIFGNIWYPNSAEGTNASTDHGLVYLCNKHYNSYGGSDISAYFGYSIADIQGLLVNDVPLPAGNIFSSSSYDFLNIGDNASSAKYYFDKTPNNGQNPTNYYGIEPTDVDPSHHCNNPLKPSLTNSYEAKANEQKYLSFIQKHQLSQQNYENAKINSTSNQLSQIRMSMTYEKSVLDETVGLGYEYSKNITKDRDKKRVWMRRFNNITGDYLLANDFFSNREYTQGLRILSNIPNKYELSETQLIDLEQVQYIYENIITNGIDNLEEITLQKLETFAESEKGKSCFVARTVLRNYGKYYLPITPNHIDINGTSTNAQSNSGITAHRKMSVYPNPTDYNVTFDWVEFFSPTKKITLEITNQSGQLVDILEPVLGSTSIEWTTELVNSGKCHYRLLLDNKEVYTGHIILNK